MIQRILAILIVVVFITGCSATRSVPKDDRLYTGSDIIWKGKKPKDYAALEEVMDGKIRPKTNRKFLGMPVKLWLYNLGNEPKGKGLNYLLRKKWGEAPVLLSQVKPGYTGAILQHYVEDNGYFQSLVESKVINKGKKKASLKYTITPNHRYTIKFVEFDVDSSALGMSIMEVSDKSVLKKDENYSLDRITQERERIHAELKERGYYYFVPDNVLVEVDSTHKGQVALYVKVKETTPQLALMPYSLSRVIIYPGYTLEKDRRLQNAPTIDFGHYRVADPDKIFVPRVLDRIVYLKEDSVYQLSSHDITVQRLMDMGTFKFVKGQFTRSLDTSKLWAEFFCTPLPQYGIQLELSGNSKSNNYVGSQVKLTSINRNWLRRANRLEVKLSAGFDWQVGGKRADQVNTSGYTVDGEVAISFPRFILPFIKLNPRTRYVPRTRISAGYELLSRPDLYNLNSFTIQYGYLWRRTVFLDHVLNPVAISYIKPSKITEDFQDILEDDPTLAQSIEKQFILGANYTVNYNTQMTGKPHTVLLTGNIDISGNIIGLFKKEEGDGIKYFMNDPFSQYVRVFADARYYMRASRRIIWANRIFAGYGYSYGNSNSLPFVKQFFIGGSNSVRAFRARTLGPGTYQSQVSTYTANEAGDIKFEMNTEARIKIFNILQGAVFFDAGNIWLQRENSEKPGAKFRFGHMFPELAVGTGIGLRLDASILILRFDLAMPLRKPWLPEGERWVIKDIRFGDPAWRKENLILNIAIGYPF
jgi:outer membrane protein assembly factor BamA